MTHYLAFDTCALVALDEGDDELVLSRAGLLQILHSGFVEGGIHLLFDYESRVAGEYRRVLQPNTSGRRLTTVAAKYSAVTYASGAPSRRCTTCLERDDFDPADYVFIGIAQRMGGLYVTTEEKHLAEERRQKIFRGCGVQIVDLEELREQLTKLDSA